jgi:toxin HigB-1
MKLDRFHHKGLRQFYEDDFVRGVPPVIADKLRKIFFAMETAESHLKGFWSLTLTGNWRLIFRYDSETNAASDIDLIDYH